MTNPPTTVIDLLQQLVRINSVNQGAVGAVGDGEGEIGSWIESWVDQWTVTGLAVQRLAVPGHAEQMLVTYVPNPGRPGVPWLLFDAHMDTVGIEGMSIEPFGGHIEGDRLHGRGAADVQGPLAAILWALRDYAGGGEVNEPAVHTTDKPNNIAVLLPVDEEVSMHGIQHFVAQTLPSLSWRPAAVIVAEPTDFHPVIAHNGCIRWRITTHGTAAHSSTPHEGHSAISDMMRIVQAIETNYIPALESRHELEHPLTGPPRCSVNVIRGGSAVNIIPDQCTIEVDRRVSPLEKMPSVEPALRAVLDGLGEVGYTLQTLIHHPPLGEDSSRGRPLSAAQHVLEQMRLPTVAPGAPFVADSAYLASPDHGNLPTLVLGPGSPHKAHTRDEWVSVQAIERGVEMYRRLMQQSGWQA